MTSKQIFDHLCLINYLRYTHKISDYYYTDVVIRQDISGWIVKQTCSKNRIYNDITRLDSKGIQKYIKSHRAEISRSLTEGRDNYNERRA